MTMFFLAKQFFEERRDSLMATHKGQHVRVEAYGCADAPDIRFAQDSGGEVLAFDTSDEAHATAPTEAIAIFIGRIETVPAPGLAVMGTLLPKDFVR